MGSKVNTRPAGGKSQHSKAAGRLTIPVRFGTLSGGAAYAALPLTIERADVDLGAAAANFCSRRLVGSILARPAGSNAEQGGIPGLDDEADTVLPGEFIVGSFTVGRRYVTTKLTFILPREPAERDKLFHFSGRKGLLTIDSAEDIRPAEAKDAGQAADAAKERA